MGHQKTGQDLAAVGEYDVIRQYAPYVISGLQRLGHNVLDVTPSENNRSLSDSLQYGINKANEWGADLFISCHGNSFNGTAKGCEVVYYPSSTKGKELATNICNEISKLGFYNRGAKSDERGLAELKGTNMTAVIVEPLFVDSNDMNLFNAQNVGYSIVKGITGQSVETSTPIQPVQSYPNYDESVPTGDNIFQIPNMPFYIEKRADGDMSIHLDRGNYITIRKGGSPEVYWNNNKGAGGSKRLF
jgi:N-acetylmuramoyl-L-alanine amidase